jgi:hypothetical protein
VSSYEVKVIAAEQGKTADWMIDHVKAVIESTDYYDLKLEPQRYYLSQRLVPTELRRTSFGGLRELQHIRLQDVLGASVSAKTLELDGVAELLRGKTF